MKAPVLAFVFVLLWSNASVSGEPPFPEGLGYPNVIRPESQFGSFGAKLGLMNAPRGVSYDPQDDLYCIADTLNDRVQILDKDGNPSLDANKHIFGLKLLHPYDVDCRKPGEIVIADSGNNRLVIVGKTVKKINIARDNSFVVAALPSNQGGYLALDNNNAALYRVDAAGKLEILVGGDDVFDGLMLSNPVDIDEDRSGNIYISDSDNSRVVKVDKSGKFLVSWGAWGSYSGYLAGPAGISISGDRVFVADQINHRIQVFSTDGKYLFQWARHPSVKHGGNGRVHYPYAISAYNNGQEAIVCEPFEHRCQVFSVAKAEGLTAVNDSAWWNKATKFHYGTKVATQRSVNFYQAIGFYKSDIVPTNIFSITEPDTHATLIFDYSKEAPKLISVVGGYGHDDYNLIRPSGVAVFPDGSIIVSDAGNRKINIYKAKNKLSTLSATGPTMSVITPNYKFERSIRISPAMSIMGVGETTRAAEPGAIKLGPKREVYTLFPKAKRLAIIDLANNIIRRSITLNEAVYPIDFVFSNDLRSAYVVDHYGYKVLHYNLTGKLLNSWGSPGPNSDQFTLPYGIAISDNDKIYVTDVGQNKVKVFDRNGKFIKQWGSWGTEPAAFYQPKGVAVDRQGRIIVTDFGNHRGQIFDLNGMYLGEFGIGAGYKATLRP